MALNFTLRICDTCQQAALVVNGVHQTAMQFQQVDGKAYVTPHSATCPYNKQRRTA